MTEPNANVTTYGYDMLDNLTSVSMGSRTFLYSSLSRQMCASNPESATNTCPTASTASQISGLDWYTYDPNGNLASHTDARGTSTNMTYDGLNRVKTTNYTAGVNTAATPNVSYLYDADTKGTLFSVTTSLGGTSYAHDKLGRVIASVQTTNGASYGFGYSYSLSDQLTSAQYPTGRTVQYGFDTADRVTSVTGPSSKICVPSITYKPASIPNTLTLANGLTETYTWNDRLQLVGLNAGNALALSIYPCDQGATWCTSGNTGGTWRETITTNGALSAVQEFRHDSLNRLLTASEKPGPFTSGPTCPDSTSVWCRQFNYDAPGNRTTAGRSPSGAESWDVSSISPTTNKIQDAGWHYDAAGNIIGANNTGTSVAVQYDAENRQVAYCYTYTANCVNTPGPGVTVYYYDGEGQRVEQIDPTTGTTVFVYDAFGNLVADYGGSAMPTSGTEYVTVDDVGTTRLITDSNANVLERHDFEPFGHELTGTEGGWRSSVAGYGASPTSVRQQFTGQERDDTGLDFFQARYFTSAQGRFASVDPGNAGASLGDPQSWNGYAYVSNSPLRFTDPTGEGIFGDILGFLGSAFGPLTSFLGSIVGNLMDAIVWGPQAAGTPGFYNPTNNFGLGNAGGLPGLTGGAVGGAGGGVYGGGSAGGVIFSFDSTTMGPVTLPIWKWLGGIPIFGPRTTMSPQARKAEDAHEAVHRKNWWSWVSINLNSKLPVPVYLPKLPCAVDEAMAFAAEAKELQRPIHELESKANRTPADEKVLKELRDQLNVAQGVSLKQLGEYYCK